MADTLYKTVIEAQHITGNNAEPIPDNPHPRQKPEIEPEKLPDEEPGIQPDTKPKKEDVR